MTEKETKKETKYNSKIEVEIEKVFGHYRLIVHIDDINIETPATDIIPRITIRKDPIYKPQSEQLEYSL